MRHLQEPSAIATTRTTWPRCVHTVVPAQHLHVGAPAWRWRHSRLEAPHGCDHAKAQCQPVNDKRASRHCLAKRNTFPSVPTLLYLSTVWHGLATKRQLKVIEHWQLVGAHDANTIAHAARIMHNGFMLPSLQAVIQAFPFSLPL